MDKLNSPESATAAAPQGWLGLGRAAQFLGVHPTTLRRWAVAGEVPCMVTPGGHRRFDLADLHQLVLKREQLRVWNGLERRWADQALQRTRQEIAGTGDRPWLAAFGEAGRRQQRELGQHLMGVMLQYVSLPDGGDELLSEAQSIGRTHAARALERGLSLVDALSAVLFFRDTLVEAAVQMPEAVRVRPE